jgi:hypothetical protein
MSALRLLAVLGVAAVAACLGACQGIPSDDRYQVHDGGRSNTRAEAPSPTPAHARPA